MRTSARKQRAGGVRDRAGLHGLQPRVWPGPDDGEAISLIRAAFDLGCTFFDTAEAYGAGHNEELVGRALAPLRDRVVIATKLHVRSKDAATRADLARQIRTKLEVSLTKLGTDHVELYYQHRVSKDIPVEDVAGTMGELIAEGKGCGRGQSQVTEEELRQAHAVTPLTAIQSEYSIMERMFERDVIPACAELGRRVRAVQPAGKRLPRRQGLGRAGLHGRRRPAGHHALRRGERPRQPAAARPAHRLRR